MLTKLVENPHDSDAYLYLNWATNGTNGELDDGLYWGWNSKKVLDILAPRKLMIVMEGKELRAVVRVACIS